VDANLLAGVMMVESRGHVAARSWAVEWINWNSPSAPTGDCASTCPRLSTIMTPASRLASTPVSRAAATISAAWPSTRDSP
jgi:hypothetical protein